MTLQTLISVVFTCKGRPNLTELCLRRFKELMPQPYELFIAYDGLDFNYEMMLWNVGKPDAIIENKQGQSRFALINKALDHCDGNYYMHLENDFYWQRKTCLGDALDALDKYGEIDYIRFESLPFGGNIFGEYHHLPRTLLGIMKKTAPYQFSFNPHIRRAKFPCGRFMENAFTKQPEQHHNDDYHGTSACLFGENFRHLGIYDEGGHYKPYYAERFTLRRGERTIDAPLDEFKTFCSNPRYQALFRGFLDANNNSS